MSKKEKLIERIKSNPKDFTYDELKSLLGYLDYDESNKGKTSGSRVCFISENRPTIMIHKPHSRKELLEYQVKQIVELLTREGLI